MVKLDKEEQKALEIQEIVYPMWQAASLGVDLAHEVGDPEQVHTIRTGLDMIDSSLNPIIGGSLVTNLGRPSNGKTFLSNYMLLQTVARLEKEKRPPNEICILITAETSVEVTALYWAARFTGIPVKSVLRGELTHHQMDSLDASVYQLMDKPIFFVGHSTKRSKDGKKKRPNLNPQTLNDAVEFIVNDFKDPITDQHYEPVFTVTDYLQRLHKPDHLTERTFFNQCVSWAKDLAIWTGGIHWLNVQAKREVDKYDIKIPMMGDGMETSATEHNSQVMFSTHMPKQYGIQMMPEIESQNIPELLVTDNLMYVTLLKQQEGDSMKMWPVYIDFNTHNLQQIDLNQFR